MTDNVENKNSSSKKLSNIIITVIFIVFCFGLALATIISEDRDFSEMENRNLSLKPKFSVKSLKDGEFTSNLENYISDQLFFKDKLVSLKVDTDKTLGKNLQNDVYFCKDGYIMQKYTENQTQIDENISYINNWAEKIDCPVDFLIVPNAVSVLSDKLPSKAVNDNQKESLSHIEKTLSSKINFYNAYEPLSSLANSGVSPFYKTDHHWTSEGAHSVVKWYMDKSSQTFNEPNYKINIVSDFYGTLYSKAPSFSIKADEMNFYDNVDEKYNVDYISENKTTDSLYDESFLAKKDKYSTFMGGNFAQTKISTNAESDKKVLILKDSYANTAIPFLADQYSEITMIDMRYYHFEENTVSELVKLYDVDRVILLYNMDFINSDQNFIWLE